MDDQPNQNGPQEVSGDEPKLLTDKDALPLNVAIRQEFPDGLTMNSEEAALYEDQYDELDFEQDKFLNHKGGKGRTKGEIHENHRTDPSGNVRKVVTNIMNSAKNQREPQIAHHSPNYYEQQAAAAKEAADAEKIAQKAAIDHENGSGKGGKNNHKERA